MNLCPFTPELGVFKSSTAHLCGHFQNMCQMGEWVYAYIAPVGGGEPALPSKHAYVTMHGSYTYAMLTLCLCYRLTTYNLCYVAYYVVMYQ